MSGGWTTRKTEGKEKKGKERDIGGSNGGVLLKYISCRYGNIIMKLLTVCN
jgi:hypothetical protein